VDQKQAESQVLLVVNMTEWMNLCNRGSIRMNKRRALRVNSQPSTREMNRVFASAPHTKLGSSVDLFVLVLDRNWTEAGKKHRVGLSDVLILDLAHVKSHHPVSQQDFGYFQSLGSKCGVDLSEAIFEDHWLKWVESETLVASCEAAIQLQKHFGVRPIDDVRRFDGYKWEEIAKLVLQPRIQIKSRPGHVETLLKQCRQIVDAVANTRDTENFYLASAVEWVIARSRKNPQTNPATKDALRVAFEKGKGVLSSGVSPDVRASLALIDATFPKAFSPEISSAVVGHVVRVIADVKNKKLNSQSVYSILEDVGRNSPAATLITFVISTLLGVEYTRRLIRTSQTVAFSEMNWDALD